MAEFKLGDRVLVKWNVEGSSWAPQEYIGVGQNGLIFFSDGTGVSPKDVTIIPLTEDTIKYLGSTQDIPVPWEPKPGELVAVKDDDDPYWQVCVFIEKVTMEGLCADIIATCLIIRISPIYGSSVNLSINTSTSLNAWRMRKRVITDDSIQNVYKQCFEHDRLRVSSEIMMELLEEIAEYRGFRLKKPRVNIEDGEFLEKFLRILSGQNP